MYYVYILASKENTVLYVGVTNDLKRRVNEHINEVLDGFTKKYHVHKLVYYEGYPDPKHAIAREKQVKHWSRAKKEILIASKNPNYEDLIFDEKGKL